MAYDRRRSLKLIGGSVVAGSTILGGCSNTASASAANTWATGGTAAMRSASYPDPFTFAEEACSLTCEQILGPCWAPRTPVRQDISEGADGIPLRMAFRLIDAADCAPIPGAELEIWHTTPGGVYTADDVQGGEFCTNGDEDAVASYAFRGRGIADDDGRVTFDSCFPGWYGGRALHVHLLVRMPEHAGEASTANMQTVTQFYFPDELTTEICDSVPGYVERGQPDRMNTDDGVLRRAGAITPYTFGIERMDDGAMLAWKTIALSVGERCGFRGRPRRS